MKVNNIRLYAFGSIVLSAVLFLSNSSNPPDGKTGAPFDGLCSDCHGGGSFQGDVSMSGIPATIAPNTTYNVTLTLTATNGSPSFGGFQLVAVNSSNQNSGDLINTSGQTGTSFSGGREYIDQRGGKAFSGGSVSWNFDWLSPNGPNNGMFTFYFAGNFTNGNNSSSGDAVENSSFTTTMVGGGNPLVASISSKTNVSCFGGMDGTATASATGGNPPYAYEWSTGSMDNPVTGLTMGTYTVTATDNSNSTATATVSITQPSLLQHTTQITRNVTCPGGKDGAVNTIGFGGTPPYTYNYSSGSANNLSAGIYSVTVSDSKGCQSSSSFEITQPEAFQVQELVFDHPSCPNAMDGQIQVNVTGATAPYKYKWSSNETNNLITNKGIGNYKLTITDNKNCNALKSYDLVSVDSLPPILKGKSGVVFLNISGFNVLNSIDFIESISDACDNQPSVSLNMDTVYCLQIGSNPLVITAKDKYGNVSKDTIALEVKDSLSPQIDSWPDSTLFACNVPLPVIKATDNCQLTELTQLSGPKDVPYIPTGENIFGYIAVDQSGNKHQTTFIANVVNPLNITLDSLFFEPCYGDSAYVKLKTAHSRKAYYRFIHENDSIWLNTDSTWLISTVRPDTFEVSVLDSNLCLQYLSHHYTYPDSTYAIDSVVVQHEMSPNKGSIQLYPSTYDSLHIFSDTQFVNNTGIDLIAGQYYLHVFVNTCTYVFGPYAIQLVIAANGQENGQKVYDIYPNPFQDKLNIVSKYDGRLFNVKLLNSQGNLQLQESVYNGTTALDLSHLASGYYILLLQNESEIQAFKLVKQ